MGPNLPDDRHQITSDLVAVPLRERFPQCLRIAEVGEAREPQVGSVVLRRLAELQRAQDPQRIEEVTRDQVRAGFAAGDRRDHDLGAEPAAQVCECRAILVVRVCHDVQHAKWRGQSPHCLGQPADTLILRQHILAKRAQTGKQRKGRNAHGRILAARPRIRWRAGDWLGRSLG